MNRNNFSHEIIEPIDNLDVNLDVNFKLFD